MRRRARVAEDRAVAQRARTELHAALEPAERLAFARGRPRRVAISAASSSDFEARACALEPRLDLGLRELPGRGRRRAWRRRSTGAALAELHVVADERRTQRAAGVAGRRLHPDLCRTAPSRRTLPLATQLSATPPARQRLRMPVSLRSERVRRSTISSVTACIDAARSMWCCVSSSSGLRGGPPNSVVELAVRHRQAGAVVEVRQVEPERAVVLHVDQVLEDRCRRTSARRRAPGPSPCTRRN